MSLWLNIKESGLIIHCPDPKTFVPNINSKLLRQAIQGKFNQIKERPEKYLKENWSKVYVILTYCRILYTLKTGKIKSKKQAAE